MADAATREPRDSDGWLQRFVRRTLARTSGTSVRNLVVQGGNVQIGDGNVQYIFEAALRPGVGRMIVVATPPDRTLVRPLVDRLSRPYAEVRWDEDPGDTLTDREAEALAGEGDVFVFWSVHARASRRVQDALAKARCPHGVSLDATPLPAELQRTRGRWPSGFVLFGLTILLAAAALVQPTLSIGAAASVGLALAFTEAISMPARFGIAGRLIEAAEWLPRATVRDILRRAETLLDGVFGDRIVSRHALGTSASMSVGLLAPLVAVCVGFGWAEDPIAWGSLGARSGVPLALGNIAADYLALACTRSMIRRVLARPTAARLAAGLLLDLLVFLACGWLALRSNVLTAAHVDAFGGGPGWTRLVLSWLGLLVTGGINPSGLVRSPFGASVVMTGIALVTGSFASLVHLSMIAMSLFNRIFGGIPARAVAGVARAVAHVPAGPTAAAYLVVAVAVAAGVALGGRTLPRSEKWVPEDLPSYCTPCVVGEAAGGETALPTQSVVFDHGLEVMDTEVTQAMWRRVLAEADDRLGVPEAPSLFRGRDLPVENVTWCDAARFANLWSIVDERHGGSSRPVYGPDPSLPGCEAGAPVAWDATVVGARLPTEVEWEALARAGTTTRWWSGDGVFDARRVGWLLSNSGARGRPVASRPANDWHLYDMHGSVWEWTWDTDGAAPRSGEPPSAGAGQRVIRGGSFVDIDEVSRSAFRQSRAAWDHVYNTGFRLVRGRGPREDSGVRR
jgi:formylglycine-generating enzyme required for sulfatase activity